MGKIKPFAHEQMCYKEGTFLSALTGYTRSNNTSGRTGVYFCAKYGKRKNGAWKACIRLKGKLISLGYYEKFEDAVKARQRAEEEYFHPILEKYGAIAQNDVTTTLGETDNGKQALHDRA